ncbi:phage tail protein [Parasalinivibrio latis]|uniref:phage tail protein n=1 Tax=Parasalinivibrio latis TaxID=2952610 RepID=UPI0030E34584
MAEPYTKTKLEHLTEYMVAHLNCNVLDNAIDAWQESATIEANGEDRGNGGCIICNWRYRAVISIEEFPHHQLDPRNLLALVSCWLTDYDGERNELDLEDPELSVDVLDHQTADVSIELDMVEPVEMIPDPAGMITWRGEKYRVQAVPIYTAEEAEIVNESDSSD